MKKFNPKEYKNKKRVYQSLGRQYPRISKLWIWNEEKREYEPPQIGRPYLARKYLSGMGEKRKRISQFFASVSEAQKWQVESTIGVYEDSSRATASRISFNEFLKKWWVYKKSDVRDSTVHQYQKLLRCFGPLMDVSVEAITPAVVDDWIAYLKNPSSGFLDRSTRMNFRPELRLLSTILNDYIELNDFTTYISPIKKRHKTAIVIKEAQYKPKDLTPAEFEMFRRELLSLRNGKMFSVLATVQYYQVLRISEVAALSWNDVHFNDDEPNSSNLVVTKSVEWLRKAGTKAVIKNGFKNSKCLGGIKRQPLFKQSYDALKSFLNESSVDLVFSQNGKPLEFRAIQYAYTKAFKKAGLPYLGTHVLRHGGTRRVYNKTSDLAIAGQLLGNKEIKSITTYAQRDVNAITEFAKDEWAML